MTRRSGAPTTRIGRPVTGSLTLNWASDLGTYTHDTQSQHERAAASIDTLPSGVRGIC